MAKWCPQPPLQKVIFSGRNSILEDIRSKKDEDFPDDDSTRRNVGAISA